MKAVYICGYSPFSSAGKCVMGLKVKVPKVGVRVDGPTSLKIGAFKRARGSARNIDGRRDTPTSGLLYS